MTWEVDIQNYHQLFKVSLQIALTLSHIFCRSWHFLQCRKRNSSWRYCWLLKSCTTWDVWNPINNGINYLSTGAGFHPSAVSILHESYIFPCPRHWSIMKYWMVAKELDLASHVDPIHIRWFWGQQIKHLLYSTRTTCKKTCLIFLKSHISSRNSGSINPKNKNHIQNFEKLSATSWKLLSVLEVASEFFSLKSSNFPSKAPWQKYETGHGGLATNCVCFTKSHGFRVWWKHTRLHPTCRNALTFPDLDSFAVHANLRGGVRGGGITSSRSLYYRIYIQISQKVKQDDQTTQFFIAQYNI